MRAEAQRSGDRATMSVIYALGAPQALRGQPTAYVSFNYEADCAAKTLRLLSYDFHAPDGAVTSHPSTDQAAAANSGVPATTLLLACGKGVGAKGYSDINSVLADAAAYVKSQRAIDPAVKHSFVFTGLSKGTNAGPVRFYVDTATLDRSVDPITAYTVEVFEKPIGPQIKPGAYTLSAMSFACKAKTSTTTYSVLYEPDGARLEGGLAAVPTVRDMQARHHPGQDAQARLRRPGSGGSRARSTRPCQTSWPPCRIDAMALGAVRFRGRR